MVTPKVMREVAPPWPFVPIAAARPRAFCPLWFIGHMIAAIVIAPVGGGEGDKPIVHLTLDTACDFGYMSKLRSIDTAAPRR